MNSISDLLRAEPYLFDFFQAVRLLGRLDRKRKPVGLTGPPANEIVRFRAHLGLSFPPSAISDLENPTSALPCPRMTVTFLGLFGPSGILPRHYTELLIKQEVLVRTPERRAFRDWLDLFNHRLISLFVRAWEKYRFPIAFERGEHDGAEPDSFTRCLYSIVGLGLTPLRKRLRVSAYEEFPNAPPRERMLAHLDDLTLLHYAGLLAQRPRSAVNLESILDDFFALRVKVQQFLGCWLQLDEGSQTQIGLSGSELGVSAVAGERVWDVQSKVRIRLGPLHRAQFDSFLPDQAAHPYRKAFFLLVHLVRFFLGPELDFDVQLVLRAPDVPETHLSYTEGLGPRLGWNTWILSAPAKEDADDAVFEGEVVRWLGGVKPPSR